MKIRFLLSCMIVIICFSNHLNASDQIKSVADAPISPILSDGLAIHSAQQSNSSAIHTYLATPLQHNSLDQIIHQNYIPEALPTPSRNINKLALGAASTALLVALSLNHPSFQKRFFIPTGLEISLASSLISATLGSLSPMLAVIAGAIATREYLLWLHKDCVKPDQIKKLINATAAHNTTIEELVNHSNEQEKRIQSVNILTITQSRYINKILDHLKKTDSLKDASLKDIIDQLNTLQLELQKKGILPDAKPLQAIETPQDLDDLNPTLLTPQSMATLPPITIKERSAWDILCCCRSTTTKEPKSNKI